MKLQAVVFDFDGLILDTEAPEFAAWQDVFRAYGAELPLDVWTRCVGTILNDWTPSTEQQAYTSYHYYSAYAKERKE